MMLEYLKYAGILIVLIIIQKTLIWLIAVTSYEITPDIVLIGLVYICIRSGKLTGTISGFLAGLIMDVISFSFLGLMALSIGSRSCRSSFRERTSRMTRTSLPLRCVVMARSRPSGEKALCEYRTRSSS